MKHIIILAILVLIISGCATPAEVQETNQENAEEDKQMAHNMDNMPCHQMPSGEWMGKCDEESMKNAGVHEMRPVTSELIFILDMIPHHQEAVDTAKLTLETSENEALIDLLNRIITAQEAEITMMNSWLEEWYPDRTEEAEYMNMMGDLESVAGFERDNLFLKGMILHHEMAVMMAEQVLTLNPKEEVGEFANDVITAQTSEIEEMKTMLQ